MSFIDEFRKLTPEQQTLLVRLENEKPGGGLTAAFRNPPPLAHAVDEKGGTYRFSRQ